MDPCLPITRRVVLFFGMGTTWAAERQMHLSLLPLYTNEYKPVSFTFLAAASAALERTYLIVTAARKPEFYGGTLEGEVLLDYLSLRDERVMAVIGAPIRARARNYSGLRNVCGNAYSPSDLNEWPRESIITTYEFRNIPEQSALRHLGVVAVHELGHNLGAWDCADRSCYMNERIDLSGTNVSLPSRFCRRHRDLLWQYLR